MGEPRRFGKGSDFCEDCSGKPEMRASSRPCLLQTGAEVCHFARPLPRPQSGKHSSGARCARTVTVESGSIPCVLLLSGQTC
ncbi:hypothetical protein Kim5_CH00332 [Rhizobium sp. Kim5]|nr:hypothetical protein Kim5_CH00332 [Rhizobium sp. Kim5]